MRYLIAIRLMAAACLVSLAAAHGSDATIPSELDPTIAWSKLENVSLGVKFSVDLKAQAAAGEDATPEMKFSGTDEVTWDSSGCWMRSYGTTPATINYTLAWNGRRYQWLDAGSGVLQISKNKDLSKHPMLAPIAVLMPYDFYMGDDADAILMPNQMRDRTWFTKHLPAKNSKPAFSWDKVPVKDDDALAQLHDLNDAHKFTIWEFVGGTVEGRAFNYAVLTDASATALGPRAVFRIDAKGNPITASIFLFGTDDQTVPAHVIHVTALGWDEANGVALKAEYQVTKYVANGTIDKKVFVIDPLQAKTILDMDTGIRVQP